MGRCLIYCSVNRAPNSIHIALGWLPSFCLPIRPALKQTALWCWRSCIGWGRGSLTVGLGGPGKFCVHELRSLKDRQTLKKVLELMGRHLGHKNEPRWSKTGWWRGVKTPKDGGMSQVGRDKRWEGGRVDSSRLGHRLKALTKNETDRACSGTQQVPILHGEALKLPCPPLKQSCSFPPCSFSWGVGGRRRGRKSERSLGQPWKAAGGHRPGAPSPEHYWKPHPDCLRLVWPGVKGHLFIFTSKLKVKWCPVSDGLKSNNSFFERQVTRKYKGLETRGSPIPASLFRLSKSMLDLLLFQSLCGKLSSLPRWPHQKPWWVFIDSKKRWGGFKPGLGPSF